MKSPIKYAFSEIKLKFPTFKLDFENFYRFYYDNMINIVKPYDGVKDFLLQLVKQNINFGVVTNGNEYQRQMSGVFIICDGCVLWTSTSLSRTQPHKKMMIEYKFWW